MRLVRKSTVPREYEKYDEFQSYIGESVCLPIYIKPYQRKTGELGYTIYIQKPSSQTVRGEHF